MHFVYDPDCKILHANRVDSCADCHESVCPECRTSLDDRLLCRACSAARRDSQSLVDAFEAWHVGQTLRDGVRVDVERHPNGAVAKIDARRFIGQITIWRNGCCDVEFMSLEDEAERHFIHRVLVSPVEVQALLSSGYAFPATLEGATG
jgi:hypothetical protein